MASVVHYPINDVQLYGTLKLWGWFEVPILYVKQINSDEDINNLITSGDYTYYGRYPDDSIVSFIVGTGREFLLADAQDFNELNGVVMSATTDEVDSRTYGNGYTATILRSRYSNGKKYPTEEAHISVVRTIRGNGPYDNYNMADVRYATQSNLALGNLENMIFTSATAGSIFVTYEQNGVRKFVRLRGGFRYWNLEIGLSDSEGCVLVAASTDSNYMKGLYGCLANTILSFNDIAGGTGEINELPVNPYEPGGPSGPGELPPGTFDDDSDPIPDSPLPTLSSANTGFTRIYNPTLSQVKDLARYLWTDETVLETIWNHIKQFFENPMEAIIGFNLVPVPVPDGGTKNFALMYIDTGVQMTVAANQFVDQDCGSVKLERYYGSALDQSPYTKVSCFLPFIGTVQLNTDEVMGTTLSIKYRVDICSGSCVAKIFVDGNCLYQYSGHCAIPIPISAADFSSYVSSAISVAKLAIGAATAGAAGLAAAGATEAAQQTNQVVTTTQETMTARNPSTGRQITTGTRTVVETRESPADQSGTQASFSGMSPQNIANTVGQIMSSKPHVEHSGSFSGNTGYLGVRRPFLIIERPNMCMPASYQSMNGFPAMITMELGTCKGFTQVQQVQLTGMSATNPEQAEIMQLLKMGVII